jgi:hypothetical protein
MALICSLCREEGLVTLIKKLSIARNPFAGKGSRARRTRPFAPRLLDQDQGTHQRGHSPDAHRAFAFSVQR